MMNQKVFVVFVMKHPELVPHHSEKWYNQLDTEIGESTI